MNINTNVTFTNNSFTAEISDNAGNEIKAVDEIISDRAIDKIIRKKGDNTKPYSTQEVAQLAVKLQSELQNSRSLVKKVLDGFATREGLPEVQIQSSDGSLYYESGRAILTCETLTESVCTSLIVNQPKSTLFSDDTEPYTIRIANDAQGIGTAESTNTAIKNLFEPFDTHLSALGDINQVEYAIESIAKDGTGCSTTNLPGQSNDTLFESLGKFLSRR
ncbi:hypothetical protein BVY03_00715 [bacterium K02(2017)]|nr:hypothetical protein BVY03_00715 [bacterium K02(2017)]